MKRVALVVTFMACTPIPDVTLEPEAKLSVDLTMTGTATEVVGCWSTFVVCEAGSGGPVLTSGTAVIEPSFVPVGWSESSTEYGTFGAITEQLHPGVPIAVAFDGVATTTAIPATFELLAPATETLTRSLADFQVVWTPSGATTTIIDADYDCSSPSRADAANTRLATLAGDPGTAEIDLGAIGAGDDTCNITLHVHHDNAIQISEHPDGTGNRLAVTARQQRSVTIHTIPD